MLDFPVIDAHIHLLDQRRFRYSWAKDAPALGRDWTADDLAASTGPYRLEGFVFVEVDVDPPQHLEEAGWVDGLARTDRRILGCVASLPLERGRAVEPEMARLAALPVARGVRRLIQKESDPDFPLRADFLAALRLLPRYGLSFDICIYHHQLAGILDMVRRCPEVSFVLDHIGKPAIRDGLLDPWRDQIRELARLPNVHCKLSGLISEADHGAWTPADLGPYINHVIDCFGLDRLMYGGDWPVNELAGRYARWIGALDEATAGLTAGERRKLFRDNAIRFYRLAA